MSGKPSSQTYCTQQQGICIRITCFQESDVVPDPGMQLAFIGPAVFHTSQGRAGYFLIDGMTAITFVLKGFSRLVHLLQYPKKNSGEVRFR
jgi:hypothetical protein